MRAEVIFAAIAVGHALQLVSAQTYEGVRCGPFHGWVGCAPSELPECCSQYGYCSDVFRRAIACAQEKLGVFFDGDSKKVCIKDDDCRRPNEPGNFFCSQEPATMGYCGIRNVTLPFTGKNPFITATLATTQPKTQERANVSEEGKSSETTSVSTPSPRSQESSSSSIYSTFGIVSAICVLLLL